MTDRNYPVPAASEDDARFSLLLSLRVSEVLTEAGYPRLTNSDYVELQQMLARFLYEGKHARTR